MNTFVYKATRKTCDQHHRVASCYNLLPMRFFLLKQMEWQLNKKRGQVFATISNEAKEGQVTYSTN